MALATIGGAVVGGVVGFFYLTAQGLRLRERVEPFLDGCLDEIQRWRLNVDKARAATDEGWRSVVALMENDPDDRSRSQPH